MAIPTVINNIEYIETLGRGGHGVVYRGLDKRDDMSYACKAVDRRLLAQESEMFAFEQEIRAHEHLKHPNIVQIHQILYHEKVIVLVMEFCENRDLIRLMMTMKELPMSLIRQVFSQMLCALNYLHERGISHGDIKPENILFDSHFNVKLADFGCVNMDRDRPFLYQRGTFYYSPPEAFSGKLVTDGRPGDVWALGVVLFAMVTGKMPWKQGSPEEVIAQIQAGDLHVPLDFPAAEEALVRRCCTVSIERRATVAEMINERSSCNDGPATSRAVPVEPPIPVRPVLVKGLAVRRTTVSQSPKKAVTLLSGRRTVNAAVRMRPMVRRPVSRSVGPTFQQVVA